MAARIAMIATTIISSIKVKPETLLGVFMASPFVFHDRQMHPLCHRFHNVAQFTLWDLVQGARNARCDEERREVVCGGKG